MRSWRAEQREKALGRFCRLAPYATLDRHFRALLSALMGRLGGIEAVATALVRAIKTAQATDRGNDFVLCAMLTITRLMEYCEEQRAREDEAEREEFAHLSSDELKARTRESIISLIRAEPEIAVAAAEALGWTVLPPTPAV